MKQAPHSANTIGFQLILLGLEKQSTSGGIPWHSAYAYAWHPVPSHYLPCQMLKCGNSRPTERRAPRAEGGAEQRDLPGGPYCLGGE